MPAQNTPNAFGTVARGFHWLTALLILTAIPLGLIANGIEAGPDSIALKAQLFSLHKTLGIAAFFLGLARILWALTQARPVPLHPNRRWELTLAELVHWLLYLSLVIVPLSGWVHHAAVDGFAPILWPFGQGLPFVPKSQSVADLAGGAHWLFTKLLAASVLLHVAGAIKHHVIDRDATLRRMTRGLIAPDRPEPHRTRLVPLALALTIYAAGGVLALNSASATAPQVAAVAQPAPAASAAEVGAWQVTSGTLGFTVQQMGAAVEGSFGQWQAEIRFDDSVTEGLAGRVEVEVDLTSVTLGSVTDQVKGPEFLDTAAHPKARFIADLIAGPEGLRAEGRLSLRGQDRPVTLPFTLDITDSAGGDRAAMTGTTRLDRRNFGIGAGYGDEETVGFAVQLNVALEARRN